MVRIIMHGCNGHMGQVISNIVEKDAKQESTLQTRGKTAIRYSQTLTIARWKQMLLSIFPPRRLLIS